MAKRKLHNSTVMTSSFRGSMCLLIVKPQTSPAPPVFKVAKEALDQLPREGFEFRILDAFLTHAPTTEGVEVIASDIVEASKQEGGLVRLANFYKDGLLLPSE
jgi:hypothetical protein